MEMLTRLKKWSAEASRFRGSEADLVQWNLEFSIFELERLMLWNKAPRLSSVITGGCFHLTRPSGVDASKRATALKERLSRIHELMKDTVQRVTEPYTLWQKAETDSLEALKEYLLQLPSYFPTSTDEIARSVDESLGSLETYNEWLISTEGLEGLPIDSKAYRALLELRRFNLTLEQIENLAKDYLNQTTENLERLAAKLDGSVAENRKRIRSNHPESFEQALEDYKMLALEAKEFVLKNDLITLPEERLEVVFTPKPMRRFLSIAAAGISGFFEEEKVGYFYLTPHGDPTMREEHNYAFQSLLISHESYPGHHVHGGCKNLNPTPSRSTVLANVVPFSGLMYSSKLAEVTEGWRLYCEGMMFDNGFKNDPMDPVWINCSC